MSISGRKNSPTFMDYFFVIKKDNITKAVRWWKLPCARLFAPLRSNAKKHGLVCEGTSPLRIAFETYPEVEVEDGKHEDVSK